MTTSPPYSLTRRLTGRVLALVALGWLAAAAGALWVLEHETAETLDDALAHEAHLLAAMADRGAALPSQAGDDRTVQIIGADGVGERPLPAPTPDPAPDPDDGSPRAGLDRRRVQGDADGLAILIRNLVENALRHGTGPVRVTLSAGPRLTVGNPAAPGARFRLGRLDRDPASEGTGLGLTIAARLAEQAGARLVTDIVDGTATVALDWGPGRRD